MRPDEPDNYVLLRTQIVIRRSPFSASAHCANPVPAPKYVLLPY